MPASIPWAIAASSAAVPCSASARRARPWSFAPSPSIGPRPGIYANAPVLWKRRPAGHITGGAVIPSLGKAVVLALVKPFGEDAPYRSVVIGEELELTPYAPPR